jgi:hypothetical protein
MFAIKIFKILLMFFKCFPYVSLVSNAKCLFARCKKMVFMCSETVLESMQAHVNVRGKAIRSTWNPDAGVGCGWVDIYYVQ